MSFNNMSLRIKISLVGVIPLLFLVAIGIISIRSISSVNKSGTWVEHTYTVLEQAGEITSAAVDMETGMRGFLLAGKNGFLDPYKNGEKQAYEKITTLQKTVSDNPRQVKRLDEIRKILKGWQENVTEPAISLRQEIGNAKTMNDMAKLVGEAKGKKYFDKFRSQINTFISREEKLLNKRKKEAKALTLDSPDNIKRFSELNNWVEHTYKVIMQVNAILATAVDMETGMRGYLLAGEEEFLDPYKKGETGFYKRVAQLKETVSDNLSQVQLLEELKQNIKAWQNDVTEPTIQLRREIGDAKTMDDMARIVGEARGKQYFDKFRQLINEFSQIESTLMEKRKADKASTINNTKTIVIAFTLIAIAIAFVLSFFITRAITSLVAKGVDMANRMADGDLTQQINIDQKDEIGILISALNKMSKNLQQMFSDIASSTQTLTASSSELATISEQISKNSEQTAERSNNVSASSEEMATNMNSVAASTEQTASNIKTVVSAIEEMSSTINEIARNTATGSETTTKAVETAEHVSLKVGELGKSASEINKVTETIADISEQTNLLALNATIEAARAGEAGKGFAVVAGEIKALAQQTAEATKEISDKIAGVQSTTKDSIEAIESIVKIINEINEIAASVATAIEEQSVTTQEISNNVTQASQGVQEINDNISQASAVIEEINTDVNQVNVAAGEMNSGSQQVKASAEELSELAVDLSEMIKLFKI